MLSIRDPNSFFRRVIRNLHPVRLWGRIGHGRFSWLKFRANGMLDAATYKKICRCIAGYPQHPFVEIGSAAGAGTVAIAWGFQLAGNRSKVLAIEKCEGGSRSRFGGYSENVDKLNNNLRHFGVNDQIVLYTSSISTDDERTLFESLDSDVICGFMHDADGRLDRDFAIFWPRVIPGGLIIVDDCPEVESLEQVIKRRGSKGKKEYITKSAWSIIVDAGLVENVTRCGATVFAYKPDGSGSMEVPVDTLSKTISQAEREFLSAVERI